MDADERAVERALMASPDDAQLRARFDAMQDRRGIGWFGEQRPPGVHRARGRRGVYIYQWPSMPHSIELAYVQVAQPFYVGRFHITRRDYSAFCRATNHRHPKTADFDEVAQQHGETLDLHPVVNVSFDDARAYCEWAKVALPTREQWTAAVFSADRISCERCNSTGAVEERGISFGPAPFTRRVVCPDCHSSRVRRGHFPWGDAAISDERAVTARHLRYGYWLHSTAAVGTVDALGQLVPARPTGASFCGVQDAIGNAAVWIDAGVARVALGGSFARAWDRDYPLEGKVGVRDVGFRIILTPPLLLLEGSCVH